MVYPDLWAGAAVLKAVGSPGLGQGRKAMKSGETLAPDGLDAPDGIDQAVL